MFVPPVLVASRSQSGGCCRFSHNWGSAEVMHSAVAAAKRRINVLGIWTTTLLFGIYIIYFRIRIRRRCSQGDSDGRECTFVFFCDIKASCSVLAGGEKGSGSVLYMFLHVGRCGEQHLEASVRLHTLPGRTRPQSESAPYACDWRAPVVAKQSCSSCAK